LVSKDRRHLFVTPWYSVGNTSAMDRMNTEQPCE
jgi:hypothetical protein